MDYDIDAILGEVKKRREEQESDISESQTTIEPQDNIVEDVEVEEETTPVEPSYIEETDEDEELANELVMENQNVGFVAQEVEKTESNSNPVNEKDMVNIAASRLDTKKTKKKKRKKKILIALVAIFLVFVTIGVAYQDTIVNVYKYLTTEHNIDDEGNSISSDSLNEWGGMKTLEESFDPITEDSRYNISSYKDFVKTWYKNGTPVSSTHVLNVLLIGEDTRGSDIEEEGTRADSAIVVSINTDTKKIHLTSILRDSYCYYEIKEGDETTGRYGKINGAMSKGGVDCYIRTVENMFKINIDNYVIVNFDSFETIIDDLGGVTVDIKKYEIREINKYPDIYGNVYIDGEPGELKLTGEQALAYCRIRHTDSDDVRADRQKTVLIKVFEMLKDESTAKLINVVTDMLPYVKTGYSNREVISIAKYALKYGWLSYDTDTYTVPSNETDEAGNITTTCKGGTFWGVWCWKIDYPLASQILQQKIYGKTNITLATYRPDFSSLY